MRLLRPVLCAAGLVLVVYLVARIGTRPIAEALARLAWWHFALLCLFSVVVAAVDALAWRYAFARDRAPLRALFGARVAGDAVNLVTAMASVGGEAVKAWLIRGHVPYRDSIPSLVIAKTTGTIGQALFLLLGLGLAWAAIDLDSHLMRSMLWLLLAECVAVGGFVLAQLTGIIGRAGRVLRLLGVPGGDAYAQALDGSLRQFYRDRWSRLLASTALHFAGWTLGGVEAFLILFALDIRLSLATAMVIEAFGTAVRFAAFLVPASIGVSEAANAGALAAVGAGAGAGLAFSFVRRARQAVWVGVGLLILVAMRARAWASARRRVSRGGSRDGARS
jgi:hypothetical protein